jgi:hypothetical protein
MARTNVWEPLPQPFDYEILSWAGSGNCHEIVKRLGG